MTAVLKAPEGYLLSLTDTRGPRPAPTEYLEQYQDLNPCQQHLEFSRGLPSKCYSGTLLFELELFLTSLLNARKKKTSVPSLGEWTKQNSGEDR